MVGHVLYDWSVDTVSDITNIKKKVVSYLKRVNYGLLQKSMTSLVVDLNSSKKKHTSLSYGN